VCTPTRPSRPTWTRRCQCPGRLDSCHIGINHFPSESALRCRSSSRSSRIHLSLWLGPHDQATPRWITSSFTDVLLQFGLKSMAGLPAGESEWPTLMVACQRLRLVLTSLSPLALSRSTRWKLILPPGILGTQIIEVVWKSIVQVRSPADKPTQYMRRLCIFKTYSAMSLRRCRIIGGGDTCVASRDIGIDNIRWHYVPTNHSYGPWFGLHRYPWWMRREKVTIESTGNLSHFLKINIEITGLISLASQGLDYALSFFSSSLSTSRGSQPIWTVNQTHRSEEVVDTNPTVE